MRGLASCFEDFEGIWMLLASPIPKIYQTNSNSKTCKNSSRDIKIKFGPKKRVFANVVRHLGEKCYK